MKKVVFFAFSIFILIFVSCASSQKGVFDFSDGVFSYDFERVTENVQSETLYRAGGLFFSQLTSKNAKGFAVKVKNRAFKIPETDDFLSIKKDGSVFSPTNPSVFGKLLSDGRIFWSGSFSRFGQTVQISEMAFLSPISQKSLAPSRFDGEYKLEEGDFSICFSLKNGFASSDFGSFFVDFDGNFCISFVMSIFQGTSESESENAIARFFSKGNINADGSFFVSVFENRADFESEKEHARFFGKRVSLEVRDFSQKNEIESAKKENAPEWFSWKIEQIGERVVAFGAQTARDKKSAVRIAVMSALSSVFAFKAIEDCSKSALNQAEIGGEKCVFRQTMFENAKSTQDYTILDEFFDENSMSAFVRVEVK